ncbi:hypothetical protein [uncultured Cytophaga sp.]|uniref:DUF6892 domain-containing protein n=1 Tax=uncultured Cytophaga sp. TaxID=160238 RepID=UPI00260EBADB|nr:hypothetical protein [uncultured Cytophaga sp.]
MLLIYLSSTDFQINNVSFTFPIEIEKLRSVLVEADRVNILKNNSIYTWDELGILAYSKDGNNIESLCVEFQVKNYAFSPKNKFSGTFNLDNKEIRSYYKINKKNRIGLFEGDTSGAFVFNDMSVWFNFEGKEISMIQVKAFNLEVHNNEIEKNVVPKDKYVIKELEDEEIRFVDFGFKLAVIQELMYNKGLLEPKFDLYEFAKWYPHRKIDIEKEGYEPIEEVTEYFRNIPIPKKLALEVTEINQDGGNDIYMDLLRFGDGCETYWDIECIDDVENFPNIKTAILCYAKDKVLDGLNAMGIKAEWI